MVLFDNCALVTVPVSALVGSPVQFVSVPDAGVPNTGVTSVGDILRTFEPDPVDVVTPDPPLATGRIPDTWLVNEIVPTIPYGPVTPVTPVAPVYPVTPVAPVYPVTPVAPVYPVTPVAPVYPVYPWGPWAPVGPVYPVYP